MTTLERWFEEVWNQGRESAIDEMMSPNTIGHGLSSPDGKEIDGMPSFKSFYKTFRSAFPDIHIKVEDTVTEGDQDSRALCRDRKTHRR